MSALISMGFSGEGEGRDLFFGEAISASGETLVTRGIIELEAKIEEEFHYDDEIETGENGCLQVSFESSYLSIGPNTTLSLDKKQEGPLSITCVTLDRGIVRSKLHSLDKNEIYEVITDSGTARVKGTDFVVSFDPKKSRALVVTVIKGEVSVSPSEGGEVKYKPVWVKRNHTMNVNEKGKPTLAMRTTSAKIEQLKVKLPLPGDRKGDRGIGIKKLSGLDQSIGYGISFDLEEIKSRGEETKLGILAQAEIDTIEEDIDNQLAEEVEKQSGDIVLEVVFEIEAE